MLGDGDLGANEANSLVTSRAVLDTLDVLVAGESFWALEGFNVSGGDFTGATTFLLGAPALGVPGVGRAVSSDGGG